jgi:hypothetical protein
MNFVATQKYELPRLNEVLQRIRRKYSTLEEREDEKWFSQVPVLLRGKRFESPLYARRTSKIGYKVQMRGTQRSFLRGSSKGPTIIVEGSPMRLQEKDLTPLSFRVSKNVITKLPLINPD